MVGRAGDRVEVAVFLVSQGGDGGGAVADVLAQLFEVAAAAPAPCKAAPAALASRRLKYQSTLAPSISIRHDCRPDPRFPVKRMV